MVNYMEDLVNLDEILALEEQNLLALAYKNVIDPMRFALHIVNASLTDTDDLNPQFIEAQQLFAQAIREEIQEIAQRAIQNVDGDLTKPHKLLESEVLCMKLKGDYFRYLAESKDDEEREHIAQFSLIAYKQAMSLALASLSPCDPLRLGVALNFATFYHTIAKDNKKACSIASTAFDEAVCEVHTMTEEARKDSDIVLKMLHDCVQAWTADMATETEDGNAMQRDSVPETDRTKIPAATIKGRGSVGF